MDGILSFDEMNRLDIKRRSEDYSDYFSEMDLTDEQEKERISYSKDTEDVLLFIMTLIAVMSEFESVDKDFITETLTTQYRAVVASYTDIDEYLDSYINEFSSDFIATTFENIYDVWFLSEDRAMFNAENEANTALNYKDYITAIAKGYTRKEWVTFKDNRVRKTHKAIDGKVIPIKGLFEVGKTFMAYPKDLAHGASNHPEETIGCRCVVRYIK